MPLAHGERLTVSAGVADLPESTASSGASSSASPTTRSTGRRTTARAARASTGRDASRDRRPASSRRPEHDRHARFLAAAGLARAVDARDAYTGEHSAEVGELAARIGRRHGPRLERVGAAPPRRQPARRRQARDPRGDPPQAGPARARPSGSCSSGTPRSASGCSTRSASSPSRPGCCTTTSAGTAAATRTASPARRSRSGARILFVADAYDAMTTDRVYRGRLSHERALRELERCAGTQFDPTSSRRSRRSSWASPSLHPSRSPSSSLEPPGRRRHSGREMGRLGTLALVGAVVLLGVAAIVDALRGGGTATTAPVAGTTTEPEDIPRVLRAAGLSGTLLYTDPDSVSAAGLRAPHTPGRGRRRVGLLRLRGLRVGAARAGGNGLPTGRRRAAGRRGERRRRADLALAGARRPLRERPCAGVSGRRHADDRRTRSARRARAV